MLMNLMNLRMVNQIRLRISKGNLKNLCLMSLKSLMRHSNNISLNQITLTKRWKKAIISTEVEKEDSQVFIMRILCMTHFFISLLLMNLILLFIQNLQMYQCSLQNRLCNHYLLERIPLTLWTWSHHLM